MSLSAREQHALDGIEDALAGSDSDLAALLSTFTRLAAGEEMPAGEKIPARRHTGGHRSRWRRNCPAGVRRASPLSWMPAVVIVITMALITVTVALTGGSRSAGGCVRWAVLGCVSPAQTHQSAQHR